MIQLQMSSHQCKLCGMSQTRNRVIEVDGFTIMRCKRCRLVAVQPIPESIVLEQHYVQYAPEDLLEGDIKATETRRLFWALQRKSNIIAGKDSLLDVGCGYGFFLQSVRDDFNKIIGVELSKSEAQYARETLGLEVFEGYLPEARFAEHSFDAVTMWDVIEHLADPFKYLREINRIMRIGAILVISTPNVSSITAQITEAQWRLWAPPEHLYYFNASSLKYALRLNGFKVRIITTYGLDWFNLYTRFFHKPYNRSDLLFTSPKRIEFDRRLRRLGVIWTGIRAINVITKYLYQYLPIGDTLCIIAVKANNV